MPGGPVFGATTGTFHCPVELDTMNGDSESADSSLPAGWLAMLTSAAVQQGAGAPSPQTSPVAAVVQSLVDLLPLNLVVKDGQGRRVFGNRTYLEIQHGGDGDVLGKTDFDLFPEEMARKYRQDDEEVLRTGAVLQGVEEWVLPDGGRRSIERIKGPVRNGRGEIVGVQVIFWDVTDKLQAEEVHGLERDLLSCLMDNIPDAIYFKDQRSRFLRVSRSQGEKFGLERAEDAIGKTDADMFTTEHAEKALADERKIMETGEPLVAEVEKETWANRADTWVSTTKMPLRNRDGETTGTFGISRDVTELKRTQVELTKARDAAEAASRAKSEFLANVSHEIRTPMNGIIGMTELLLSTQLTSEQREYQTIVKNSAAALLSLLNSILDFSKIEAGRLELETFPFGLRDTLGETLHTMAAQAAEKGLELAVHIPRDVPDRLEGDPARLRQVVVNLVGNAIKFTEEGEVVVSVSLDEVDDGRARLQFAVRDTGSGIPPEKQAIVFEAFSQADSSTTRHYGGTGLGLAISSELVRLMGGRIWLESKLGEGSTFFFTTVFPVCDQNGHPLAEIESLVELPVLVVDDNQTNRFICEEMLKSWGMRPTAVASGAAALDTLREAAQAGRPYRLMLLDVMMPEMDGFEVARRVKQDPAIRDVPIVILSSAGRTGRTEEAARSGVAHRLTKPITQSDLLNAITSVLGVACSEPQPADSITGDRAKGFTPRRILLAEDGLVNQKVATSLLEKRGHQVTVVNNGREAVEATADGGFDVVLMDVQMPVMDGFAATAEIRRRERQSGDHQPIIAMTAHAMKGDRQRCLDAGMDGYVAKPFRLQELFELVETAAGRSGDGSSAGDSGLATLDSTILRPSARPFNRERALVNAGGSDELFRDLVELFVKERTAQMDALREARETGDSQGLARAAHTLKGSISMFAAPAAFDAALKIEQIARDGNLDGFDAAWENLEREVETLMAALDAAVKDRRS